MQNPEMWLTVNAGRDTKGAGIPGKRAVGRGESVAERKCRLT